MQIWNMHIFICFYFCYLCIVVEIRIVVQHNFRLAEKTFLLCGGKIFYLIKLGCYRWKALESVKYSLKTQWMWRHCDHTPLKYLITWLGWGWIVICAWAETCLAQSSLDAAQPLQLNEALRPQTCLTLPSGLAACVWQHSSLLRSRPTECQRGWWWCIFWLPRFFLLSTRLYTFSLCQCQRSICPLPTQTPARARWSVWTLFPATPLPLPPPACHRRPPSKPQLCEHENTQIHTYATKLMSGKPQQLQSHSHNETVTKLYPPIPLRVTRF